MDWVLFLLVSMKSIDRDLENNTILFVSEVEV